MGYNMYRQLTYTIEDSPYSVQERIQKNKKRTPSLADLENIRKYRMMFLSPLIFIHGYVDNFRFLLAKSGS